jgi:hypothetical protein
LNDTQISEPGFRMVGINTSHDRLDTFSASSTQQMSMASIDLSESAVSLLKPRNTINVPFAPRISWSSTW